jgi:hypothetical protein
MNREGFSALAFMSLIKDSTLRRLVVGGVLAALLLRDEGVAGT